MSSPNVVQDIRDSLFVIRESGIGNRYSGFGIRDSGFGIRDSGIGDRGLSKPVRFWKPDWFHRDLAPCAPYS